MQYTGNNINIYIYRNIWNEKEKTKKEKFHTFDRGVVKKNVLNGERDSRKKNMIKS